MSKKYKEVGSIYIIVLNMKNGPFTVQPLFVGHISIQPIPVMGFSMLLLWFLYSLYELLMLLEFKMPFIYITEQNDTLTDRHFI